MNFKQWLENRDETLAWNNRESGWVQYQIGMRATIQAYIVNGSGTSLNLAVNDDPRRRVSIDSAGPYHPFMKRAIRMLVRQFPYVKDYPIEFDGYKPGTVMEYLKSSDLHGPKDVLPKYLYHGTSLFRWERIREEGLKPSGETGADPAYGASISTARPADPECVYLSGSYGATVRWASNDAYRGDGSGDSKPIILRVNTRGLERFQLEPDPDSRKSTWQESLWTLNSIAYRGSIAPNWIEVYKIWDEKADKFNDPRSDLLEPQDWLAQQMLHRNNYKKIPGVGRYKWAR